MAWKTTYLWRRLIIVEYFSKPGIDKIRIEVVVCGIKLKFIADNKNECISGGARDLHCHGIADKKLNAQMVFDAVEDQFVVSALQSNRSEMQ